MDYECKLIPAKKITSGFINTKKPLCSICANKECTNPIIEQKISVYGIIHSSKLYKLGEAFYIVTNCDGFMKPNGE